MAERVGGASQIVRNKTMKSHNLKRQKYKEFGGVYGTSELAACGNQISQGMGSGLRQER